MTTILEMRFWPQRSINLMRKFTTTWEPCNISRWSSLQWTPNTTPSSHFFLTWMITWIHRITTRIRIKTEFHHMVQQTMAQQRMKLCQPDMFMQCQVIPSLSYAYSWLDEIWMSCHPNHSTR